MRAPAAAAAAASDIGALGADAGGVGLCGCTASSFDRTVNFAGRTLTTSPASVRMLKRPVTCGVVHRDAFSPWIECMVTCMCLLRGDMSSVPNEKCSI